MGVQQRESEVSVDSVISPQPQYHDIEQRRLVTIARLWNITETLNVLYRENWTMMANVEIIKFQNEMIQSIKQEMRAEGDRHQDNCNLNKVVRWVI